MGLFGLFTSSEEVYKDAFEKGVLLGESHYNHAIALFDKAGKKALEEGDAKLANRAVVNAALYRFLLVGRTENLIELSRALSGVERLEAIGSASEVIPVESFRTEINARIKERALLEGLDALPPAEKITRLEAVAELLKSLSNQMMITYKYYLDGNPNDQAKERSYYYLARAFMIRGEVAAFKEPSEARDHYQRAINQFNRCKHHQELEQVEEYCKRLSRQRICWMCQREFQGQGWHFDYFSSYVTDHVLARNNAHGDPSTIDAQTSKIVLCFTCISAIRYLADEMAARRIDAIRMQLEDRLSAISAQITRLEGSVRLRK